MEIDEKQNYVSANKTYEITCRSRGSKPPAALTWWRGSKQLKHATKEVSLSFIDIKRNLINFIVEFPKSYIIYFSFV